LKKLILILILFPVFSIAQNSKGVVVDKKDNLPIEDVNITMKRINTGFTTDGKGRFNLKIQGETQENDTITFSHTGYITKKMIFSELQKNKFSVVLDENIEYLNNVNIIAIKTLNQKIAFTKLAPLQYALSSFGSILKNNKIYVIGGDASSKTDAWKKVQYEKVDPTMEDYLRELSFQFSGQAYIGNLLVYDINTNQWETSKLKFRKRAYHNLNEYSDKIYVLGGKRVSVNGVFEYLDDKIEVFNINKQIIEIDNTNPHQAAEFASFTYKDNLIIMGGSVKMSEEGKKVYSNKVHSYDINSGYWYELENMPIAKETNGVLIKNKIYLIGGFNSKPLTTVESYDLDTGKWETEGELFSGLSNPAITFNNEIIYFFENEKIYTYNIYTKQLKEFSINLPLKNSKLHFSDNKLYLLGGYFENYYSTFPSSGFFSIDIDQFDKTKPIQSKFL
jgi:hypothetical protein